MFLPSCKNFPPKKKCWFQVFDKIRLKKPPSSKYLKKSDSKNC